MSRPVVTAINRYVEERHISCVENWERVEPIIEMALRRCERLLNAPAGSVEFVQNTSEGLSILAEGIEWRPGDRIAVPACEFPANVYPFLNLRARGVEIDWIPHSHGCVRLEDIASTLRPETRLLTISWVQFLSGATISLDAVGALCRANDTIFCVDAIQGLGALQVDVRKAGIDFLSTGAQKWLMGTRGLGFVYVAPDLLDAIRPRAGWLHGPVDWDDFLDYRLKFHPDARRLRLGTLNMLGIVALNASLELYEHFGAEQVERMVLDRASYLAHKLDDLGFTSFGRAPGTKPSSGIVTVRSERASAIFEVLTTEGVTVSVRNGMLRFSPTFYNSPDEIDIAVRHIQSIQPKR